MCERADWLIQDYARVIENFLKLGCGCAALARCQKSFATPQNAKIKMKAAGRIVARCMRHLSGEAGARAFEAEMLGRAMVQVNVGWGLGDRRD